MKKLGRIILLVISLLLFLFGIVFLISLLFFPEWLGLDNWVKNLIVVIFAAFGTTLIEIFLGLFVTELANLTNFSKLIHTTLVPNMKRLRTMY